MYPRMLCRTDINYTRTIIKRFCRSGWRITGSDNWYLRHRPAVNRPELSVTDIVFDWLRAFRDSAGLCGLEHRVDTLRQSYLSIAPRYSDCPQKPCAWCYVVREWRLLKFTVLSWCDCSRDVISSGIPLICIIHAETSAEVGDPPPRNGFPRAGATA